MQSETAGLLLGTAGAIAFFVAMFTLIWYGTNEGGDA